MEFRHCLFKIKFLGFLWYNIPQCCSRRNKNPTCVDIVGSFIERIHLRRGTVREVDIWQVFLGAANILLGCNQIVPCLCRIGIAELGISGKTKISVRITYYSFWEVHSTQSWDFQNKIWAASSEFVSSSIPSWQILTAHAQPFRGARDLAFCLKVSLDSLLVWASSEGSGETARMRRLAWTFPARIGDKYQIHLTRSIWNTPMIENTKNDIWYDKK